MENLTNDSCDNQPTFAKGKTLDAETLITFPGFQHLGLEEAERVAEKIRDYAQVLFHSFQNWKKKNENRKK